MPKRSYQKAPHERPRALSKAVKTGVSPAVVVAHHDGTFTASAPRQGYRTLGLFRKFVRERLLSNEVPEVVGWEKISDGEEVRGAYRPIPYWWVRFKVTVRDTTPEDVEQDQAMELLDQYGHHPSSL